MWSIVPSYNFPFPPPIPLLVTQGHQSDMIDILAGLLPHIHTGLPSPTCQSLISLINPSFITILGDEGPLTVPRVDVGVAEGKRRSLVGIGGTKTIIGQVETSIGKRRRARRRSLRRKTRNLTRKRKRKRKRKLLPKSWRFKRLTSLERSSV